MKIVRGFVGFWVDFIIGDAWEVAAIIALALVAIAYIADAWGGRQGLGFLLAATVIGVTWLALLRATAAERHSPRPAPPESRAEAPVSAGR